MAACLAISPITAASPVKAVRLRYWDKPHFTVAQIPKIGINTPFAITTMCDITAGMTGQLAERPIRAVVFDMGDVLYDASQWRRWLVRELNALGVAVTFPELVLQWERELVSVYKGREVYLSAYDRLLQTLLPDFATQVAFKVRSLDAKAEFEAGVKQPFEGVGEMLAAIRSRGFKLGVLSDTESIASRVWRSLDRLSLASYFDTVVTSRDIGYIKPEPEAYAAVLQCLGVLGSETVFVGHDQDELDGAKAYGMATVAVETTGPTRGHYRINAISQLALPLFRTESSSIE